MKNVYDILENIDLVTIFSDYDVDRKIKQGIIECRDEAHRVGDEETVRKCQVEVDTLSFVTRGNVISYTYAGTDNSGNPFEYPSLKAFKDEDFDYLSDRLKHTKNLYLIARYSHILWHSVKKHNNFAISASKAYTQLAKNLYEKVDETDTRSLGLHVINLIENAVLISSQFKNSEEYKEAREFLLKIVKSFSLPEKSYLNTSLIHFMLDQNKIFNQTDLAGLENELYTLAQKNDNFRKIDILQLGKRVDTKLGNNNLIWEKEIGEAYEKMSYDREDETKMISTQFAQEAIKYYKKAKEEEKVVQLTKRYKELKENMQLGQFSKEIDLTEIMEFVRRFSDEVSDRSAEQIFFTLMYDGNILPKYSDLEQQAYEHKKNHPMMFLASAHIIDSSGHVSEYFDTDEEHIYQSILQNYHFSIQFCRSHLLREIFIKSIRKGKLTPSSFVNFMQEKSWLGQDIKRTIKQGEEETYNWLYLLAPAINDYILQLHFYLHNHQNIINLVLCIDSLTLKIEGILRDICDMRGGTSFFFAPDKKGRSIAREKDINALLHDDTIKNFISKDDMLFLKFLLVEKAGLNLRNNVAHSLFRKTNNYSIDFMNLLIVAIFTIAKNEYYPSNK